MNLSCPHHKSYALYRKHALLAGGGRSGKSLELLKAGGTRFATSYLMLERLCYVRPALERLMLDQEYKMWV
jgi:hypothetical protein